MGEDLAVREAAEDLYARLGGHTTLYDDREASAGVKLKDADLLGMPLRLTVSARSLAAGGVELRVRRTGATHIVSLDAAPAACAALLAELDAAEAQHGRRGADTPIVA
jgi:prolyl-tRNA synthetase